LINNFQISEHFKLSEFECREGREVKLHKGLIIKLEKLRKRIGQPLIINSGYRTPEYNKKIGGAEKSQHMKGTAADIRKVDGLTIDEMASLAEAVGFDGIGKYDNFIHVDVRGYRARWDNR
jgi:uncharacterized protein YcbK (DUF882 family)